MVRVGQRTMLYRDMFTVNKKVANFCNYRCSYCWPYARSSHASPSYGLCQDSCGRSDQSRTGFNSFHFSLSVGAYTFHPDIWYYGRASIVQCTQHKLYKCTYASNCSRNMGGLGHMLTMQVNFMDQVLLQVYTQTR